MGLNKLLLFDFIFLLIVIVIILCWWSRSSSIIIDDERKSRARKEVVVIVISKSVDLKRTPDSETSINRQLSIGKVDLLGTAFDSFCNAC